MNSVYLSVIPEVLNRESRVSHESGNKAGCPITNFGHDKNENGSLYTDTNYQEKKLNI